MAQSVARHEAGRDAVARGPWLVALPDAVRASPVVVGGGFVLFLATTVLNVGNFGFHVLESRALGPQRYGALGSMLGLLVLVNVPMSAIEVSLTRRVASTPPDEA